MSTKATKITRFLWILLISTIPQAVTAQTDQCPTTEPAALRLDPDQEAGRAKRAQYLLAQNPKDVEAYTELGSALLSLCRYEEAIAAYRQVTQLTSKRDTASYAYNQIGLSFRLQGKYAEAIAAYEKALQLADTPEQSQRNYDGIGKVLEAQGKYEEAISAYRKAIAGRSDPELVDFMHLESLLERLNRQEDLVKIYRQEFQRLPQNYSLAISLGNLLIKLNRFDEAEAHYRQVLQSDVLKAPNTYIGLAEALSGQGKREPALDAYQKAVEVYQPNTTGSLLFPACDSSSFSGSISDKLMERELYDLVIMLCRKDISAFPNYSSAYNQLGEAFLGQGKLPEALEAFQQATVIDPKNENAWTNLAKTERLLNQR
ncbi:MAG: tetratricopeptide repeat protein [Microcoleus vaginatus WJT46-NPBG5]|jgi:tetratricopeptide (TPR) repeat protein|nr:tetratricopeptide repeat protein [Microcoleus vaginatus WJT46-NPBG5]